MSERDVSQTIAQCQVAFLPLGLTAQEAVDAFQGLGVILTNSGAFEEESSSSPESTSSSSEFSSSISSSETVAPVQREQCGMMRCDRYSRHTCPQCGRRVCVIHWDSYDDCCELCVEESSSSSSSESSSSESYIGGRQTYRYENGRLSSADSGLDPLPPPPCPPTPGVDRSISFDGD